MGIDWNQIELVKWIGTDETPVKPRSRRTYKHAFRLYTEFTGMTAEEMIDEAEKDINGSLRERGNVKRRLREFRYWLENTYKKKVRMTEEYKKRRNDPEFDENSMTDEEKYEFAPMTSKGVHAYFSAIRSFYAENGLTVKFYRGEFKKPLPKTQREELSPSDVRKLINATLPATRARDRFIILAMYQGGFDTSTFLQLNYRDVQKGLKLDEHPLMIETVRPKTGVKYKTFLGKDATDALRNYLTERETQGDVLKPDSPLIATNMHWGFDRLSNISVRVLFHRLVIESGLITEEELKDCTVNPYGAHAQRSSFGKILAANGVTRVVIDQFLGHKEPHEGAYTRLKSETLRQIYRKVEPHLSISRVVEDKRDQLRELADGLGIDLEAWIQEEFDRHITGIGGGEPMTQDEIDYLESVEFYQEVFFKALKEKLVNEKEEINYNPVQKEQKVIKANMVEKYLNEGWRFVASVNNDKVIVEK